jgi:hypothetical protein
MLSENGLVVLIQINSKYTEEEKVEGWLVR